VLLVFWNRCSAVTLLNLHFHLIRYKASLGILIWNLISSSIRCSNLLYIFNYIFVLLNFKSPLYIWLTVLYQMCLLQTLSPSLWLVFLFSWQCLSQSRSFNFNEVLLIKYFFCESRLWYFFQIAITKPKVIHVSSCVIS
jgi:hypothetical protein